jgi:hypothetical protein
MKPNRHLLWIFLLLVPLLWLAWPSGEKAGREAETPPGEDARTQTPGGSARVTDGEADSNTRSRLSPRRVSHLTGVDRILADDAITHEQAALQLRKLAMNPGAPVEDRLEALQHGLNLHAESFADFAQQKDLPPELASHYLQEMINYNQSPIIQIRSFMDLMNHPDEEVAGLAKEMLALEVGDEEEESSPEELLVAARSKLAELAAEAGR